MSDSDDKRKEDSDKMVFRSYDGKHTFQEFDKHMARLLRSKYWTTLGDQFWTNKLPVLPLTMMSSWHIAKTYCMLWQTKTRRDTNTCMTWIPGSGKEAGTSRGEKGDLKGCTTSCMANAKAKHISALKNMA